MLNGAPPVRTGRACLITRSAGKNGRDGSAVPLVGPFTGRTPAASAAAGASPDCYGNGGVNPGSRKVTRPLRTPSARSPLAPPPSPGVSRLLVSASSIEHFACTATMTAALLTAGLGGSEAGVSVTPFLHREPVPDLVGTCPGASVGRHAGLVLRGSTFNAELRAALPRKDH